MTESQVVDASSRSYAEQLSRQMREDESFRGVIQRAMDAVYGYQDPGGVGADFARADQVRQYALKRLKQLYPEYSEDEQILEVISKLANFAWNGVNPKNIQRMIVDNERRDAIMPRFISEIVRSIKKGEVSVEEFVQAMDIVDYVHPGEGKHGGAAGLNTYLESQRDRLTTEGFNVDVVLTLAKTIMQTYWASSARISLKQIRAQVLEQIAV